jgi:hypothetical protein
MLKFGVALPYVSAHKTAELAGLAEGAGWGGVFIGDAIWTSDPIVSLAAAAIATHHIRLGTMVIPVPLRVPWKIASESIALDHLSNGRLTLGLGMGAVWMGWQGFPDVPTAARARAEMLDETIDILTLLYQRVPFDYDGVHYHLKLTLVDEMHYPPKPVQQPRIPLWVVGVWPRPKSMQRILKCDGIFPQKMNSEGKFEDVSPADIREIVAYVKANRTLTTPFDIIIEGKTSGMDAAQIQDSLLSWAEAGATWWIEGCWGMTGDEVAAHIRQGPPHLA